LISPFLLLIDDLPLASSPELDPMIRKAGGSGLAQKGIGLRIAASAIPPVHCLYKLPTCEVDSLTQSFQE